MNFRLVVLIWVVWWLSFSAFAQQAKILRVVGEPLAPVTLADGSGQQFEAVKAIFEPLGYQLEISVFPYRRALKLVESGEADLMVGMFIDTNHHVIYSRYPHDADNLLVIYPEKNKSSWHGIRSLENQNITVLNGLAFPFSSYLPEFNYQINEVRTREQEVNMLKFGRTNYVIDTEGSYLLTQKKHNTDGLMAQKIGYVEIYSAFAMTDKARKAKQQWDKYYPDFIRSSEAKSLYEKWGLAREYNVTKQYYNNLDDNQLGQTR